MMNSDDISFRRLRTEDLELMHKWLNEPHVHEWYDKNEENTFERVAKEYGEKIAGEKQTKSYLVLYDNQPVAYIQSYIASDWPDFASFTGYDSSFAGIDLFIGENEFMGIGFGSLMVRKFLKVVLFKEPGIKVCFIDPEPENKRAIRSYEKVGFIHTRTVQLPGEPDHAYLMEIKKEDFQM